MSPRQQALSALEVANQVRSQRLAWKEARKGERKDEGLEAFVQLVKEVPPWAYTWRLHEVLKAIPNFGARRVRYAMTGFGIGFNVETRLGWLNERQRDVVLAWAEDALTVYRYDKRRARR